MDWVLCKLHSVQDSRAVQGELLMSEICDMNVWIKNEDYQDMEGR